VLSTVAHTFSTLQVTAKEQEVKYFVGSLHHHHHLAVKQVVALEREQIIWVARRNSF
jgi:hypothetical protein